MAFWFGFFGGGGDEQSPPPLGDIIVSEPSDLVALGYLESLPAVTKITASQFTPNLVLGANIGATDEVLYEYALSSANIGSGSGTTVVNNGVAGDPGDIFSSVDIAGFTGGTTVYYRVGFAIEGDDDNIVWGNTYSVVTTPDYNQEARAIVGGESHYLQILQDELTSSLSVFRNTMANIAAESGSLFLDPNDSCPYAHFNASHANAFPIGSDGMPSSATSTNALSQADCEIDCRLFRRDDQGAHATKMRISPPGNHNGEHYWEYTGNCSGVRDVANWSRDAFNLYFGNSLGEVALSGCDSKGRWGAFRYGAALICVMDVYQDTRLTVTNPAVTNADQPDDKNDWTISQEQWDYFFHSTTGWVTKASPTYDSNNPTYTGVSFVVFLTHNVLGGASVGTLQQYGRGGKKYSVNKAASTESYEWGAGAAWTNPRTWAGDHASLGIHKAIVNRCKTNGCIPIVFHGHDHLWARENVDGVHYLCVPQTAGNQSAQGPYGDGFKTAGDYVDTEESTKYSPNAGHLRTVWNTNTFTVDYIRSYVAGTGATDPSDGIVTNGAVVDHIEIQAAGVCSSNYVKDSGNRISEDSVTIAATNNTQTGYQADGEPTGLTTVFGPRWKLINNDGNATVTRRVNLAVRTSEIDSLQVISTRRPYTAGAGLVRQAALVRLLSVNRRIKVKFRLKSTSASAAMHIPICGNDAVTWLVTTNNKGLYFRYAHGATGTSGIYFDNGILDTQADSGTADVTTYTAPTNTSFDNGITIELIGNKVAVFSSSGARILFATLSATIMQAIKGSMTYRAVGMVGSTNNTSGAGYIQEFRDFEAYGLGDGGQLPILPNKRHTRLADSR